MLRKIFPVVAIIILIPPVLLHAETRQSKDAFSWKGKAPALFMRNLNGPIQVEGSAGAEIEVTASVSWKESNPADIRFEVKPGSRGVTICALWPAEKATCGENGEHSMNNNKNNDLSVSFKVKLPKGTRLDSETVNGDLDVKGTTAAVKAESVNGSVSVDTASSAVEVQTVNGAIRVAISAPASGDLKFQTVNGPIEVKLPSGFDVEVEAETVNGRVNIAGQRFKRSAQVTLGKGGRKLSAETVNGSIDVN